MNNYICHVFPSRESLTSYISFVFSKETTATTFDSALCRYTDPAGDYHYCFVINDIDDIGPLLSFTFTAHHLHGTFEHLSKDALYYLKAALDQRTRQLPETV
jgi:hypothetical protein